MVFGGRLKALREKRGWTQQDLADRLNISRNTVAGYESKGKIPREDTLVAIANLFNVSTDYLLGRIDDPDPDAPFQKALAAIPDLTKPHDKEYAMKRVRYLIETVIPGLAGKEVPEAHVNIIMANIEAVIEELKKEGKQEK